jgi:hypothetical protein
MDQMDFILNNSSSHSSRKCHNHSNRLSRPNGGNRRYSARYLILIYSQTTARFDPLEIQRIVSTQEAQCTIVRQAFESTHNYFAFVDFAGKRFQTRNLRLFDIQGYHPKWLHLTSSPWHSLDQMMKRGDVVWKGVSIPRDSNAPREMASRSKKVSSSATKWEFQGSSSNESSFFDLCKVRMGHDIFDKFTKMMEQPVPSDEIESDISRNVRYWQDGYRAGYEAALSTSKSQSNALLSNSK